eukprot:TRINITY_DN49860_c0_g1_i1.p1 TRINITY_DN49860_c0_g1~~TRINITY_DN49860_c0_g1_i1.p1  ORF type:complete len:385 (-),score=30.35 TRINITY_DN49860_c0_g1_i1:94-1248(-)
MEHGFLDCACIHQTVTVLKVTAIRKLAGFLRKSDELLICFDKCYLTRAWCVYEVACFLALNPKGRVRLLPTHAYVHMFYVFLLNWFGAAAVLMLGESFSAPFWVRSLRNILLHVVGWLVFVLMAMIGRRFSREKSDLVSMLSGFDIRYAGAQSMRDKEEILRTVDDMFVDGIDGFNQLVRTYVQALFVRQIDYQRVCVPYYLIALVVAPELWFFFSVFSSFIKIGAELQITTVVWGLAFSFAVFPCTFVMCIELGRCIEHKSPSTCRCFCLHDALVGLGGYAFHRGIGFVSYTIPCMVARGDLSYRGAEPWHGPMLTLILILPFAWGAYCLFGPRRVQALPQSVIMDDELVWSECGEETDESESLDSLMLTPLSSQQHGGFADT